MIRNTLLGSLALAGLFASSSSGSAQVVVCAPFVRVQVGPGVQVQAPGINLVVPTGPATPLVPAQPPTLPPPTPLPGTPLPGTPLPGADPDAPPMPAPAPIRAMTLREFADHFRPAAGSYEVALINPVTCQPCLVRFCLPGCPNRVVVNRCEIVYRYGIGRWVRIHFDGNGYVVTSRKV